MRTKPPCTNYTFLTQYGDCNKYEYRTTNTRADFWYSNAKR